MRLAQGDETRLGGSLTTHLAGPLHLTGEYLQGRADHRERVAHEGKLELAAGARVEAFDVCPNLSGALERLRTEEHHVRGLHQV